MHHGEGEGHREIAMEEGEKTGLRRDWLGKPSGSPNLTLEFKYENALKPLCQQRPISPPIHSRRSNAGHPVMAHHPG